MARIEAVGSILSTQKSVHGQCRKVRVDHGAAFGVGIGDGVSKDLLGSSAKSTVSVASLC
jgi:hypothetical protein